MEHVSIAAAERVAEECESMSREDDCAGRHEDAVAYRAAAEFLRILAQTLKTPVEG